MVDLTDGFDFNNKPREHIQFGDFNSLDYGMWLIDRSAPTPNEKEVVEGVPYMQGHHDFSMILGERVYNNRPISYTFHMPQDNYLTRKFSQTAFENELMNKGISPLIDTYTPDFQFRGKCVGVNTTDDHVYNRLIVTVEFDAYPFKIGSRLEGNDIWDTFNFELDVAQPVSFDVMGELDVAIEYNGASSVAPRIITDAPFEIVSKGQTINVPAGTSKNDLFRFRTGTNNLRLKGNGSIRFEFYKEMI